MRELSRTHECGIAFIFEDVANGLRVAFIFEDIANGLRVDPEASW